MQAVRLHEIGGPQNLRVESVPDPTPAAGEILIALTHAAFNRRDYFITQGLYPGIALPAILGADGVGTVAALGAGVTGPAVGTRVTIDPCLDWGPNPAIWAKDARVLGMPRDGTFAEYITMPAGNVHPCPTHLTDEEAAAMPLGGLTAFRAIVTRGKVTKDDRVLITGIGGGVQTLALLFAKHVGATVCVTSSSDEKLARAKGMGADFGVNYKTAERWEKDVRSQLGEPTLVIDSAGGDTFGKCLDIAAYGARIVSYGGTAGDAKVKMFSLFWKQLDVMGSSMGSPADFAGMLAMLSAGGLRPAVDEVLPLADAVAGCERIGSGAQFGKIVLRVR
jgi:NADPH:quinone reductase-like Zn-dependent oxidoreductase